MPVTNGVASGQYVFTPGGSVFVFGRLVQDGIAERFLADRCPSPEYRLCAFQGRMPRTANDFLWESGSPLHQLGGWDALADEASRITRESLSAYPLRHLSTALWSTLEQLITVATGDGMDPDLWHMRWTVERFYPERLPAYDAARQQRGGLSFGSLNRVHVPVAIGATALLPVLAVWGWRRSERGPATLAAVMFLALLGNAAITGILSNPHDRYQSRLTWIAVAAIWVGAARMAEGQGRRNRR